MITKEHEYIPEDATDGSHKAERTGSPANRTVHYTVAILGLAERHTSLEFIRNRMKMVADECKLVINDLLQSIGQPLVHKQAATDRFQLNHRDVVAMVPLPSRPTECVTIAGPHPDTCMKKTAVVRIVGEDGMHPKNFSPTIPTTANYMQVIRQLEQITNSTCIN